MRLRFTARATLKVCGVLLLWLMSVSDSLAAHPHTTTQPCDPLTHTRSLRKLIRQARAVGGPVASHPRKKLKTGKPRPTHIERGLRRSAPEDGPAIQNDAPVAHITAIPVMQLRLLWVFVDPLEQQLFTHTSSPRSPRGPPASACHGPRLAVSSNRGDECGSFSPI